MGCLVPTGQRHSDPKPLCFRLLLWSGEKTEEEGEEREDPWCQVDACLRTTPKSLRKELERKSGAEANHSLVDKTGSCGLARSKRETGKYFLYWKIFKNKQGETRLKKCGCNMMQPTTIEDLVETAHVQFPCVLCCIKWLHCEASEALFLTLNSSEKAKRRRRSRSKSPRQSERCWFSNTGAWHRCPKLQSIEYIYIHIYIDICVYSKLSTVIDMLLIHGLPWPKYVAVE